MCVYQILNHLGSLLPEFEDDSRDVHHSLCLPLLQDMVYGDECPCPTNTSTAEESNTLTMAILSVCGDSKIQQPCKGHKVNLTYSAQVEDLSGPCGL